MNGALFKKLLEEYSSLKDTYRYEKWFSKVSNTYSGVIQKSYFDAEDFFVKEQVQNNTLFSEISKILSKEIIEKSKANEYTRSLIITYLDIKQSFDFDLKLFQII